MKNSDKMSAHGRQKKKLVHVELPQPLKPYFCFFSMPEALFGEA